MSMQSLFSLLMLLCLFSITVFANQTGMEVANLWVLLAALAIYVCTAIAKARTAIEN